MSAEKKAEKIDAELSKVDAMTESLLYYTENNRQWAVSAAWVLYDYGHDSLQGVSEETISEACQVARQGT